MDDVMTGPVAPLACLPRVRRTGDHRDMTQRKPVECWLIDMDGVLVHEETAIDGASDFIRALERSGRRFQVMTNNSIYTPRDLHARLLRSGIEIPERAIWTSALATAQFLDSQRESGSAYVIGEAGLTTALHEVGYVMTDQDPDYVVLGETRTYSFSSITKAIRLLETGARFIATNPDPTGPSREGSLPATGSVAAMITRASGVAPYFVGKPNPLMMRSALNRIEAHSETTVIVGDRMETDVVSGLEAGLRTVLVLSGSTKPDEVGRYPYLPTKVADSVADLIDLVESDDPTA
jgi:NagD protein